MDLKQHIKSILKESSSIVDMPHSKITKLIKNAVEDYVTFEICKFSVIDLGDKEYAAIIITEKPIRSDYKNGLIQHLNDILPLKVYVVIEDGIFGCGKQMNESVEDTKYKKVIGKLINEIFDGVCGFDWEVFKNYVKKGLALRIILHLTEEDYGRFDFEKYHQSKTELKELLEDFFPNFSGIFITYDTTKCGGDLNESEITERCWKGYSQKGMKTMFGKRYPNCVKIKKKKESKEGFGGYAAPAFEMEPDHTHFKHQYNESSMFNHTKRRLPLINELLHSLMYDAHNPCDYDDKDNYFDEIIHDLSWMVRNERYGLDDADWIDIYEYIVEHKQDEIKEYYMNNCGGNLKESIKNILDEEVSRKYAKPTPKVEQLVYRWLNDYFDGAQMYHNKSWESTHSFEFCNNGKEIMNVILYFHNDDNVYDDKRKTEERDFESGSIAIPRNILNELSSDIPVRASYLKYIFEEWFDDTYLGEIQKFMGRNDIYISEFDIRNKDAEVCVPPVTKPEDVTEEDMIELILKTTLFKRGDILRREEGEPGFIEKIYLGKLRDAEEKRLRGNN